MLDLTKYIRENDACLLHARNAEAAGDKKALHHYAAYAHNCLVASVNCFKSSEEGIAFLKEQNLPMVLFNLLKFNKTIVTDAKTNEHVEPVREIELTHLSWLLNEFVLADLNTNLCLNKEIAERVPGTKFWNEYCRAIGSFVRKERYSPNAIKPKGYEKHWFPYLLLIEKVTNGLNASDVVNTIESAFLKRNTDRRLIDWVNVDGDGERPVHWDFRLASLRIATNHYYNMQF